MRMRPLSAFAANGMNGVARRRKSMEIGLIAQPGFQGLFQDVLDVKRRLP
jgi:hypothetical protein